MTDLAPVGRNKPSDELTVADLPSFPPTLWELLARRAAVTPDRVLLEDESGRTMTAAEWRDAAEQVAAALFARGVTAGTTVSWQLPTTHEAAVLMLALARLGAVQNPIIPILRHREVTFIVGQTGARLLITPSVWRNFDYVALANEVAAEHGCETMVLDRGGLPVGDPSTLPPPPTGEGDPIRHIYYSSGTTAEPKGARHTDASLMACANGTVLNGSSDDVMPLPYPYTHVGGFAITVSTLYVGSRLLMIEIFDPVNTPLLMAERGVTRLGSSLPFFIAYAEAQRRHGPDPLFPKLVSLSSGGAPKPPELFYEMKALFGVPILSSWGLTEFPIATGSYFDDSDEDLAATEGRAVPGVEIKIVGPEGDVLPAGQEGEVLVRGPQALKGYVDAALDAAAFDAEGFFRSGDLGVMGPRGHLRITGRTKDIIIRNAENLSALEIEGVVYTHPKVADVAVIGVPDPRTGERACAVVVLATGTDELTLTEVIEHCRAQALANQKIPERLEIIDELPRNPMGKILKQELRKRFASPA
jgi:acyl-CoA synthetase (AMP-forming)/AMP-acid ligase II